MTPTNSEKKGRKDVEKNQGNFKILLLLFLHFHCHLNVLLDDRELI